MKIQEALHKLVEFQDLTEAEMTAVMEQIMTGNAEPSQIAAFLTALRMKVESVPEIVGAARVMRAKAETLNVSVTPVIDTCGTGGDGAKTFNISTASAFVAAGAGIAVAKHGNRAVSSRSGSADVLKCLGVQIEASKKVMERSLNEIGIAFLYAPLMHQAMKHAGKVRRDLGFRTIFNLLGPLTNPAHAQGQVVGIFALKWVSPIAHVLKDLGSKQAFVAHGEDGLDEVTLTGKTHISHLKDGSVTDFTVCPEDFGLSRCDPQDLKAQTPEESASIIRDILDGKAGPPTDIVLLNAAAAICAGDKADSLKEGMELARQSIQSGAAREKLEKLREFSHRED